MLNSAATQMTQIYFEMLGNNSSIHAKKLSHRLLGTPKGFIPDDYLYLAFLFRKIELNQTPCLADLRPDLYN